MEFRDKFIAFVDILGFESFVERAENGTGMSLQELYDTLNILGTDDDRLAIEKYGPTICPEAPHNSRNLDFQITRASDCVVVSSEISPAGAINLINHCWVAVFKLLRKGVMCRGHIRRGKIYHEGREVIGTGYQKAFQKEKHVAAFKHDADDLGTPFVEIDRSISEYINMNEDRCVREMYSRFVKQAGDVYALYPFKRLSHSFAIGGSETNFDADGQKRQNEIMRAFIKSLKGQLRLYLDESNPKAVRKFEHYERALDAQLESCDVTDQMIDFLNSPFPAHGQ